MSCKIPKTPDDPFRVLGVSGDADEKTIKSAYRFLAKGCHPDRNPDQPEAEMRFRQIQQAYEAIVISRRSFPNDERAGGGHPGGFPADPDAFGGFYWMLKNYLAKKEP